MVYIVTQAHLKHIYYLSLHIVHLWLTSPRSFLIITHIFQQKLKKKIRLRIRLDWIRIRPLRKPDLDQTHRKQPASKSDLKKMLPQLVLLSIKKLIINNSFWLSRYDWDKRTLKTSILTVSYKTLSGLINYIFI